MGYIVSSLPDFATDGDVFLVKSVMEGQTLKALDAFDAFDPTVKGKKNIELLDNDVVFQDGSSCGFNASGSTTFTQAVLTVHDIKENYQFCARDLELKFLKNGLQKGQDYDQIAFLTEIVANQTAKTGDAIEKAIWQGDTGLTASANLNKFDGFLKNIKAGSYLPLTGATAGSSTLAKVQKAVALMPVSEIAQNDFRVFVGLDTYNAMVSDLAALNIYKPTDDNTIFGTSTKLVVVNGLNGTGYIVLSRGRNLQCGGELYENPSYTNWYSKDDDVLRMSYRFSFGTQPVYVDTIGLVKIS